MQQKKRLMLWRGVGVTPAPTPFPNTYSLLFGGVDDYVDLGSDTLLEPVSALSVSAWIKRDASMVNYSGIVQSQKDTYNDGWAMVGTSANKVRFYLWATLGTAYAEIDSAITIDTWYNILGTWDGSTIRIYVNGVLQSTTGSAADIDYPTTPNENAKIGQYALAEFSGNIDEASIWNTALSSDDISTLWNEGTPNNLNTALGTTPLAWYRCGDSGTFFNSNWEIPNQPQIDNWSSHSMEFDGVDGGVNCGNDTSLQITGDITVSGWFKLTSTNAGYICSKGYYGNGTISFAMYIIGAGGGCGFDYYGGATVGTRIYNQYTSAVNDGEWHHIAGVKSGSTSILYLDGSVVGSPSGTQANIYNSSNDITIGHSDNNANWFPGSLDCVSIWDAALDANTISSIFNSGKPNDLTLAASYTAHIG